MKFREVAEIISFSFRSRINTTGYAIFPRSCTNITLTFYKDYELTKIEYTDASGVNHILFNTSYISYTRVAFYYEVESKWITICGIEHTYHVGVLWIYYLKNSNITAKVSKNLLFSKIYYKKTLANNLLKKNTINEIKIDTSKHQDIIFNDYDDQNSLKPYFAQLIVHLNVN
ncbi:hypothetical protein HZS_747 [Henneguya salminicola]|nr:hypothetical protein HZS_747 [Henneguya salminicola]